MQKFELRGSEKPTALHPEQHRIRCLTTKVLNEVPNSAKPNALYFSVCGCGTPVSGTDLVKVRANTLKTRAKNTKG